MKTRKMRAVRVLGLVLMLGLASVIGVKAFRDTEALALRTYRAEIESGADMLLSRCFEVSHAVVDYKGEGWIFPCGEIPVYLDWESRAACLPHIDQVTLALVRSEPGRGCYLPLSYPFERIDAGTRYSAVGWPETALGQPGSVFMVDWEEHQAVKVQ